MSDSLAQEFLATYTRGEPAVTPPSARDAAFDLNAAYVVEDAFRRLRALAGATSVGVKVGYANKAVWRAFKLETLVWAHMYDDTVHYARGRSAELVLPYYRSPKIEPEIVFKLKRAPGAGLDAAALLEDVEWLAAGFEIIDCPFPDWQFKPADFVAAYGLHLALAVGEPVAVEAAGLATLVEQLATFKVTLSKDGQLVDEGSGKNSLRSPALCLAELASAMQRQAGTRPLAAGDLISSGTLTNGQPITKGETWRVELTGIHAPGFSISLR